VIPFLVRRSAIQSPTDYVASERHAVIKHIHVRASRNPRTRVSGAFESDQVSVALFNLLLQGPY